MTLKREAYEALKNVVGAENISEDPAIIQSHLLQIHTEFYGLDTKFLPWGPEAVALPGSAEEIQAIVKICNRHKIKFKAYSTGWGPWSIPVAEGSILLDLRRLDRIIKIDEKNMYTVVEPYVTAMELIAETMKKGLITLTIGCGCQSSPLASVTSLCGHGTPALSMGYSGRNLLGFEWVTPTGEIVRTGSIEDGKLSDPGIGLRGVIRGFLGAQGGLGVFTKAAIKLYPWPGPSVPEVTGSNPKYGWKVPDNIKIYLLRAPDLKSYADFVYKMGEEEIAYIIWSYSLNNMILGLTNTNNEYYDLWRTLKEAGEIERNLFPLQVMLAANSEKELEYKEKALRDIMNETSVEDFLPQFVTKDIEEYLYVLLITQYSHAMIFRPSAGMFSTSFGYVADWDSCVKGIEAGCEIKKKYIEEGKMFDDGVQNFWGGPKEQGRLGHSEGLHIEDPGDLTSFRAALEYGIECAGEIIERKLLCGGSLTNLSPMAAELASPYLSDFFEWIKKIKKTFDPNEVSEASAYTGEKLEVP